MEGYIGKIQSQFVLALLLTAFSAAWAGAADLYVQAARVDLRGAPALTAPKLATLTRGEPLTRLEESGGWYRVQHGEQTGWLPRLMVGRQQPGATVSALDNAQQPLGSEARRRASQFTSAAAARGLAARTRVSSSSLPDYQALQRMDSFAVDEDEALRFLAERGQ
jgi:hypothetical protein